MAVTALTSIPCSIEAGNTVVIQMPLSGYLPTTWTAMLCLSLNGATPTIITATSSGNDFVFTLSAAATAALSIGDYSYAIYVTASSERTTAQTGTITITQNLAVAATPSFAKAQVTLLQTAIAALNTTTRTSVSLNGQSFTRASIAEYQRQLTYWEARVIRERREAAARRGENPSQDYAPRFGAEVAGLSFGQFGGCR
jgi:hypothetical protein